MMGCFCVIDGFVSVANTSHNVGAAWGMETKLLFLKAAAQQLRAKGSK
jgi:hypothetical protein